MNPGGLLIFIGLVGLAVFLWPSGPAVPPAEAEAAASAPADPAQALATAQWLAGEKVLPREQDGHFYADVTVDSQSARMLVDTGASVIALTREDALRMGLSWNDDDVRPVGQGASGAVEGVPVRLSNVRLGAFEARDIEAVIVPEGLDVSLLGQSFLGTIDRVEIREDKMILGG